MFDMSSMSGQAASLVDADAIVEGWQQGLQGMSHVFHQAGNFKVSVGDADAAAFCYGIAMHYRETPSGRNTQTFVGSYDFHLTQAEAGWMIDLFRFNLKFLDGNPSLEKG
jgi:SnoaL-like domain